MLLAIDTSTAQIALALHDGTQVVAESIWYTHQHHTGELAPALADLLHRTGVTMQEIQAIGVATGPGSFTALRVGLAFVKGLALSRKLAVIGIPTLDILAAGQVPAKLPLAAILQAGRGRIALGWYMASGPAEHAKQPVWKSQGAAEVTTVEKLANLVDRPTLVAGELTGAERQRLARKKVNVVLASPSACVRRPSILAELAWTRLQSGAADELAALAPVYLQVGESLPA
jgi:tRNA threonylcarbamoyladenosine biosynthesis protein TsaB